VQKLKTNLFNVSSANQLGSKVEVLSFSLLKISADIVVRFFKVALVRVEHNRLFHVVFPHHFKSDSGDGWLEVRLLCVDHYANVQFFGKLLNGTNVSQKRKCRSRNIYVAEGVNATDHVSEHLLFLRGQLGDESHHSAGF